MQRVTITIEDELLAAVDTLVESRGYAGRSEAVRDLLRRGLAEDAHAGPSEAQGVATLTFVSEHGRRDLPQRIAEAQSAHHDLVLSQMQIPLDHVTALHTLVLRGPVAEIRQFADLLTTQRGVRHDRLSIIPARIASQTHRHGSGHRSHDHIST